MSFPPPPWNRASARRRSPRLVSETDDDVGARPASPHLRRQAQAQAPLLPPLRGLSAQPPLVLEPHGVVPPTKAQKSPMTVVLEEDDEAAGGAAATLSPNRTTRHSSRSPNRVTTPKYTGRRQQQQQEQQSSASTSADMAITAETQATLTLVNQLVATDLAKQDRKEKQQRGYAATTHTTSGATKIQQRPPYRPHSMVDASWNNTATTTTTTTTSSMLQTTKQASAGPAAALHDSSLASSSPSRSSGGWSVTSALAAVTDTVSPTVVGASSFKAPVVPPTTTTTTTTAVHPHHQTVQTTSPSLAAVTPTTTKGHNTTTSGGGDVSNGMIPASPPLWPPANHPRDKDEAQHPASPSRHAKMFTAAQSPSSGRRRTRKAESLHHTDVTAAAAVTTPGSVTPGMDLSNGSSSSHRSRGVSPCGMDMSNGSSSHRSQVSPGMDMSNGTSSHRSNTTTASSVRPFVATPPRCTTPTMEDRFNPNGSGSSSMTLQPPITQSPTPTAASGTVVSRTSSSHTNGSSRRSSETPPRTPTSTARKTVSRRGSSRTQSPSSMTSPRKSRSRRDARGSTSNHENGIPSRSSSRRRDRRPRSRSSHGSSRHEQMMDEKQRERSFHRADASSRHEQMMDEKQRERSMIRANVDAAAAVQTVVPRPPLDRAFLSKQQDEDNNNNNNDNNAKSIPVVASPARARLPSPARHCDSPETIASIPTTMVDECGSPQKPSARPSRTRIIPRDASRSIGSGSLSSRRHTTHDGSVPPILYAVKHGKRRARGVVRPSVSSTSSSVPSSSHASSSSSSSLLVPLQSIRYRERSGQDDASTGMDASSTTHTIDSSTHTTMTNLETLEEAKRLEQARGPAIAQARARSPLNPSWGKPVHAMASGNDKGKHVSNSLSTSRQATANVSASETMESAKRRERDRGPSIATARVAPIRSSVGRDKSREEENTVKSAPKIDTSKTNLETLEEAKRRERERGPSIAIARAPICAPSTEASTTNLETLEDAKRRERERGPSIAVARAPIVSPTKKAKRKNSLASALAFARTPDTVQESKLPGHELGPTLASARAEFPVKTWNSTTTSLPSQSSGTTTKNSSQDCEVDLVTVAEFARNPDDDMEAVKRRERERGPMISSAVAQESWTPPDRAKSSPDRAEKKEDPDDELVQAKRRESERGPETASAVVIPRARISQTRNSARADKKLSSKSHDSLDVADENCDDDDAYALAMARSNMQKEALKLREQQSGPMLAPATSGDVYPGAVSIVGREFNSKERDTGPSIAPALAIHADCSGDDLSSSHDVSEELVVATELPARIPGAFAVQGIEANSSDSDYTSSDTDSTGFHSRNELDVNYMIDGVDVNIGQNQNTALEAEVYEHVVLEGAAITDDDDELLNPKIAHKIRLAQITVVCLLLTAVGLIVGTVLGLSDGIEDPEQRLEGWLQVGSDVFGPIEQPQTLFGSSVVLSGNGKRLAVSSPGTDNTTVLNVGEVYVWEQQDNENGTSWGKLDIIPGLGSSSDPKMSLAMSSDGDAIAIGYPRLFAGRRVQLYRELGNGKFEPDLLPVIDESTTGQNTWFGHSIDLSADASILAVGDPLVSGAFGSNSGAVHVYQRIQNRWSKMGNTLVGAAQNEFFGWSIALNSGSGLRIAIGSPVSNDNYGIVRIFEWTGSAWERMGQKLEGVDAFNRFGESVSFSDDGTVLAVGSSGTAYAAGQAQVYRYREVSSTWSVDSAIIEGEELGEGFGSSVALSGDGTILAIGGPRHSGFGNDASGRARVLKYQPSDGENSGYTWIQQGSDLSASEAADFGMSVALSNDGRRVAIGAPKTAYDGSISRAGSAYVYDRLERSRRRMRFLRRIRKQ